MSHKTRVEINVKRDMVESIIVAIVLTGVSYAIGVLFDWVSVVNWLEVFAVFTSYACTYLCVKERRVNYPIGVISSAAYAYLFLQSGLFSSAILNAYLVPTLIYGWIRWRKDSNKRPVTRLSLKMLPVYILVAAVGYLGAASISQALGGAMAWTDAMILAGTILAQFMLDNKKLENWVIWAIVNVFALYTYIEAGLFLVALQYVFFLVNTIYGYVTWRRSMQYDQSIRVDDSYAADNRTLAADSVR